jgi:glycosyltransferase involved in cell wall biosynthesis
LKEIIITYEHGLGKSTFGGGQRILVEVLKKMISTENNITLITSGVPGDEKYVGLIPNDNFKIIFVKPNRRSWVCGIKIFLKFTMICGFNSDLVVGFTSELYWISIIKKFKKFKLSGYLAAPDIDGLDHKNWIIRCRFIRKRFDLYLFLLGFKKCDVKLAIGPKIKQQAEKTLRLLNIEVAYPGVEIKLKKEKYSTESGALTIVYVGRIEFQQKPLMPLLQAIKNKNELIFKLHIFGNGPDLPKLETFMLDGMSDKIIIHGSVPLKSIINEVDKFDLAILPSKNESFMLTAYEMVAAGLPVVANDVADLDKNLGGFETVSIVSNDTTSYEVIIEKFFDKLPAKASCVNASTLIQRDFNWNKLAEKLQ